MYSFIIKNKKSFLVLLITYIFLSLYLIISNTFSNKLYLNITCDKSDIMQIFYKDANTNFDEKKSKIKYVSEKKEANLIYNIPSNMNHIRLDIGQQPELSCKIDSLYFKSGYKNVNLLQVLDNSYKNGMEISNQTGFLKSYELKTTTNDAFTLLNFTFGDYKNVSTFAKLLALFVLFFLFGSLLIYISQKHFDLFVIILISIFIKAIFIVSANIPMDNDSFFSHDERTYLRYVSLLFENGIFSYFDLPQSIEAAFGNLVYIYALLSFSDYSILFLRIFNAFFIGSTSIILVFLIASNIKNLNKKSILVATILFSSYGEILYFSASYLTEPIIIFLFLLFMFLLQKIFDNDWDNRSKSLLIISLIAGIVLALGSLVRLIFLPLFGILVLFAVYFYIKKNKNKAISLLSISITTIVLILPFMYNGYKHSGKLMVATGSGAVLWLGSRGDTNGDEPPYYHLKYDTDKIIGSLSHLTLEGDTLLKEAAIANIKNNTFEYVKNSMKRVYRLVIGNNYFWFFPYDNFTSYCKNSNFLISTIKFTTILLAVFIGAYSIFIYLYVLLFESDVFLKFVVLNLLALIVLYVPFLVNQRYGLPIFSLNVILLLYFLNDKNLNKIYKILPIVVSGVVFMYTIHIF